MFTVLYEIYSCLLNFRMVVPHMRLIIFGSLCHLKDQKALSHKFSILMSKIIILYYNEIF